MTRYAASAVCFLAGFVTCANLSRLVAINHDYDASFYKVAIALGIAFLSAVWEAK